MQYALNHSATRFLSTENKKITQFPDGFRLNFMEKQLLAYLSPPPLPPVDALGPFVPHCLSSMSLFSTYSVKSTLFTLKILNSSCTCAYLCVFVHSLR